MRPHRTTVRLTGIALRHQGTHDSLCAYYSAAMLLGALRPELEERFDAAHVGLDPLYANLPRPRGRTIERTVAEWLTSGVRLEPLCRALNGACARGAARTQFRFRRAGRSDGTVDFLRRLVDRGLPSLLGWESREMGDHTALVVGYDQHRGSASRWLRMLDPIRAQDVIEWGQLARLATGRLEIVWCAAHDGVRPDKLTVERDRAGATLAGGARVERWEPAEARWRALVPQPSSAAPRSRK
jgi:hypothetical protein